MELERGNCNVLVLGLVLAAAFLLGRRGWAADLSAGLLLAVATWVKVYPAVLFLGLLALRRWRAMAASGVACVAIGLLSGRKVGEFVASNRHILPYYMQRGAVLHGHSLPSFWKALWTDTPLAAVPGQLAALALIAPPVLWVSLHLFRDPRGERARLPFLLFLLAAATFVLPVAYDYSLIFLPPAALAVWDRRDPLALQLLFGALLLWWQPFALPAVSPLALFAAKLAGLAATGWALVRRVGKEARGGTR
jgi:hypothetical protein